MVVELNGRPVLSVPNPHPDVDHPGLVLFTSASIVPALRFYSFTFRFLILISLALVVIARPLWLLIKRYGVTAPEVFRNQTGLATFRPSYRSNEEALSIFQESIFKAILKVY